MTDTQLSNIQIPELALEKSGINYHEVYFRVPFK